MRAVVISSVLGLLATSATASIAARSPNPAATLFARQTGIDPTQVDPACRPTCAEIADTLNNCSDLSCLCTATAAQQIALCADCLIAVAGSSASSTQQSEQVIIDQFTNACAENGQPLSSIIVSSVSPTITASETTDGSGSQTAPTASTTAPSSVSTTAGSGQSSSANAASQISSGASPTPSSNTSGALRNLSGAVGMTGMVSAVVSLITVLVL